MMLQLSLEQFKLFCRLWLLAVMFFIKNIWQFVVVGVCIIIVEITIIDLLLEMINFNTNFLEKFKLSNTILAIILGISNSLIMKIFASYIYYSNSNNVFLEYKNIQNFIKNKIWHLITAILFKAIASYMLINLLGYSAIIFAPFIMFIEFIILFDKRRFKDALIVNILIVRMYYLPMLGVIVLFNVIPVMVFDTSLLGHMIYVLFSMIFNVNLVMIYLYVKQNQ